MPEPHKHNDIAMDAPTGIFAMASYNFKKMWIHQWTSSLNKMGPVYATAQVSSEKPPSNYATRDLATEAVPESQLQAELNAGVLPAALQPQLSHAGVLPACLPPTSNWTGPMENP